MRRRDLSALRRGITLLEVVVVLAIIGIIAAMGLVALNGLTATATLAAAPKQLLAAIEGAKAQSLAQGREVILVMVGNAGIGVAHRCGENTLPMKDDNCVRYWVMTDVVSATSTRFDATALDAFDPNNPTAQGDALIEDGYLGRGVFIGRPASYAPPTIPSGSAFFGIDLTRACSFCTTNTTPPWRTVVRVTPVGKVELTLTPRAVGGSLYLSIANDQKPGGMDTRTLAILQPGGLTTDLLGI